MKEAPADLLLRLTETFFQQYLRRTRGASAHTVRAYRDTLKLFFLFLAERQRCRIADLGLDALQAEAVLAFLDHLESQRGNSAVTRNIRLAALHSFVQHLLRSDVTRAGQYGRILAIPAKRAPHRVVSYLEPEEARQVIATVDPKSSRGERDRALLLFLYNTGARVSEALAVRPQDLRLDRPRQVRLWGKGRKERLCPLWPETASALHLLLSRGASEELLFKNAQGGPLTRDGVAYVLAQYVEKAAATLPQLRTKRVTPHVLRHSCAVALLQAGVDVSVIRDYLGHTSVATTSRYITTNLQTKREVLEAFWNRAGLTKQSRSKRILSPKLLAFLEAL
jgi:integrase/recombinase XerD